jgi:iron complex outermembrane receptor protein
VHNVLDKDPPFTNGGDSFQVAYNPAYADPLGRTYTLSLRAAWR